MIGEELAIYFENSARDALGYEHVEGCLRLGRDGVELVFDEKDRAFRKTPAQTVHFTYLEVSRLMWVSRWFRPKHLIFQTRTPERLADFPGVEAGRVDLFVTAESRADAAKAPALLEFRRSEALLAESDKRLDRERGEFESGL